MNRLVLAALLAFATVTPFSLRTVRTTRKWKPIRMRALDLIPKTLVRTT